MEYDAFVSYAHGSQNVAVALQQGLQRFAKPWWHRRVLNVFLDQTALSANPDLWNSIAEALDNSEWLLLVATPKAASSDWVSRELEHWLDRHGTERILNVVADGEWRWEDDAGVPGLTGNSVPKALLGAYDKEPRHVDLRWALSEAELDLHNPRFRDALAELAAPIRNVSKDELEGADLREHRRFRRAALAVGIALTLLTAVSVIAGIAALVFATRAASRTADADFARLVAQSRTLSESDPSLAILLAVEATRLRDNAQSNGAILATLSQDPRFVGNIYPQSLQSGISGLCVPGRSSLAVLGGSDGTVSLVSLRTHRDGHTFRFEPRRGGPASVTCSRAKPVAVVYDSAGYWSQINLRRGQPQGPIHQDPGLYRAALDPSGQTVALSNTEGSAQPNGLRLVPLNGNGRSKSAQVRTTVNSTGIANAGLGLQFSPDGRMLATVNADRIRIWDTSSLTEIFNVGEPSLAAISATPRTPLLRDTNDEGDVAFSPDGKYLVASAASTIEFIDLRARALLWSEPTGWYAGSQVGFSADGRLLVNRSAGEIQQLDVRDGDPVGGAITPNLGVALDFVTSGSKVIIASNSNSAVALYDFDSNGPITRAWPSSGATSLLEYDQPGASLLLSLSAPSALFQTTRSLNDRNGALGPTLPSVLQPRFIEPHVVGGFLTSFQIGELDSRTGQFVTAPYFVPFIHATNAQFYSRAHVLAMANTGGDVDSYTQHGKTLASPWVKLGTYPVLSSSGFSEDGSIAVFDNALRQVWVVDREGKVVLHKTSDVTMAATSPDGRRLAILYDLRVAIFDSHTGAEIGGAIGVPPGSTDIEWSSDGSRILAFGQDEGQLIDAVSVQPLGDPLPSSGFLALRSDGNEVATMSNGAVLLWNTNLTHLREAACFAAGRNMTQAEWSQYLPNQGPYQRVCSQWP